jgi:hypothetical protein
MQTNIKFYIAIILLISGLSRSFFEFFENFIILSTGKVRNIIIDKIQIIT